mmetsp:Transcript_33775/g.75879  ORF Transcript_33775/g.75879 Transcript_33775/m.75879 type:complete len:211 (+) Transcript_33775:1559-2191(+)
MREQAAVGIPGARRKETRVSPHPPDSLRPAPAGNLPRAHGASAATTELGGGVCGYPDPASVPGSSGEEEIPAANHGRGEQYGGVAGAESVSRACCKAGDGEEGRGAGGGGAPAAGGERTCGEDGGSGDAKGGGGDGEGALCYGQQQGAAVLSDDGAEGVEGTQGARTRAGVPPRAAGCNAAGGGARGISGGGGRPDDSASNERTWREKRG